MNIAVGSLQSKNTYVIHIAIVFLNFYSLRALNIFQTTTSQYKIKTLPERIINLNELESIVFYFVSINKFPIELLVMPNIQEIAF